MTTIFYDGGAGLMRASVISAVLYVLVIAFIRFSGKRSTSQMNNFDWIVTVAMGSLVASGILLKDVTIAEVAVAITVLLLCQYIVTKTVVTNIAFTRIVKSRPRLLFREGRFQVDAMQRERVTEREIRAAIRGKGIGCYQKVAAVVLEADATLSVIATIDTAQEPASALEDVSGWHTEPHD